MMKHKLLSLALLVVSALQYISAQPYCDVHTYSLSDGLSANVISDFCQTSDNLMWFGTWNGLCYFDGYRFATCHDGQGADEALYSNRILSTTPNKEGNLWVVGFDRHLYLYDTHRCCYVSIERLLGNRLRNHRAFRRVMALNNGHTWVAADNNSKICLRIDDRFNADYNPKKQSADELLKVFTGFKLLSVHLDNRGREWMLTDRGVRTADGRVTSGFVATMAVDNNGTPFFIARNGMIATLDHSGKRLQTVGRPAPGGKPLVVNYACAWRGYIALATSNGLYLYRHGQLQRQQNVSALLAMGTASAAATHLFVDNKQRLWVFSAYDGMVMVDGQHTERLQARATALVQQTTSSEPMIHQDHYGTIWTVPTGGTLSYYDERQHRLIPYMLHSEESPLVSIPLIKKVFTDHQGNLWFAGNRNLTKLSFRYQFVTHVATEPNCEVRALCMDRNKNIWVGDYHGTLAVYDSRYQLKGYVAPSGAIQTVKTPFTSRVYSIFQDRRGRMWIGSKSQGLYCIDHGAVRHFAHNAKDRWSLSNDSVYDLHEDSKGRLWVATFGGGINLVDEQGSNIRFINAGNALRNYPNRTFPYVRRITSTNNGVMLVSTNRGLITFSDHYNNPADIRFFTTMHHRGDTTSLAGNDVMQTLVTKSGKIYVILMGGAAQSLESSNLMSNNLRFKNISTIWPTEGLVQSMIEDGSGNIWFVRETTMDKFSPSTHAISVYGIGDMAARVEFTEAEPIINTTNGHIILPANGAFVAFNAKQMVKSNYCPRIVFTNVQYQGDAVMRPILNTQELEVPSNRRSLTIFFAALDYSDNQLLHYAYKLEGSSDWTYVTSAHSASFNHLPSGHLKLLVRSTNADGVWQNNTQTLLLYVHPTFWESWMGWLLYLIIGGALIYLIIYLINQQQRIKLQHRLNELMTQFFTNIGHKLRTPLTLIGGPVKEVMRSSNLSDRDRGLLDMVSRNSENMLKLVDDMLNYDHNPDNYLVDDNKIPATELTPSDKTPTSMGTTGSPASKHHNVKLLVVEDNDDLRNYLSTILNSNYTVITAENGLTGLQKARSLQPDFIISDVMMPVMDGLTMVHELKGDTSTSHIPIIILSAKASVSDRLKGLRYGIDDYITKPFSAIYLKERVSNIISRRHLLQQEIVEQLSSSVDTSDKKATSNEVPADNAQPKEYRLSAPDIIDEDKAMMDKLMNYLEQHIGNPDLKMEDMAAAVNLGRTVFYGKMRSIVGMAPVEFMRHIRMQRAEELIVNSKMGLSQVAYAVGFSDPKYFSKCFKKMVGMSPSEYRTKGGAASIDQPAKEPLKDSTPSNGKE